METLILTIDMVALMVVIYFSNRNEKHPDQPEAGPFRIIPYREKPKAPSRAVRRR